MEEKKPPDETVFNTNNEKAGEPRSLRRLATSRGRSGRRRSKIHPFSKTVTFEPMQGFRCPSRFRIWRKKNVN